MAFSRFEIYDNNVHSPSKFGKTLRIAATSILNLNVSAANLETCIGSILSWRRQLELEQKAMKINEVILVMICCITMLYPSLPLGRGLFGFSVCVVGRRSAVTML